MNNTPFHVKLLLAEIQNRKQSNPRYSLRAFAKFLGIGPSTLSRVLTNNQELSLAASKTIIKKLKFNRSDCLLFIASVAEEKKLRALRLLSNTLEDSSHELTLSNHEWMLSSSPDLMFVLDKTGRCIHANDPVSKFFNVTANNVTGKTMMEMGIPSDIAKKIKTLLIESFKIPKVYQVDECYQAKEGRSCFEITLVPIIGNAGEIRAVACHWRDITEKNELTELLMTQIKCGEVLNQNINHNVLFEDFLKTVTEKFCDACCVHLIDENKFLKDGDEKLLSDFSEFYPLSLDNQSYSSLLKTAQTQTLCHMDEANLNILIRPTSNLGPCVCVPFCLLDQKQGTISYIRSKEGTPFRENHFLVARDLALRTAITLNRSLLFEESK